MIGNIFKKLGGYIVEVSSDAAIIKIIDRVFTTVKSPEFDKVRLKLIKHGPSVNAEFTARTGKALDAEEFKRFTKWMKTLNPEKQKSLRCSIVAIGQYEDRRKKVVDDKVAKKTTSEEFCIRQDDAVSFLKVLGSDQVTEIEKTEICKAMGFLDPHFDLKDTLRLADVHLASVARHIDRVRRKMQKTLLPPKKKSGGTFRNLKKMLWG